MDDQRFGATVRAIRIRRRLRQKDVARLSGAAIGLISQVERGHLDGVTVAGVRAIAKALDVRVDLTPRWRAGDLDRLLNARHSALHEQVARMFAALSDWVAEPEVSFAIYGERGIIDILAWHAACRMLLVIELKTDIADVNELVGTLDRKRRLAVRIATERGWGVRPPVAVSAWVIVADSRTNRRRVHSHGAMLRAILPMDGRSMPGWLGNPDRAVGGLSFWPDFSQDSLRSGPTPIRRVRAPARRVG